MAGTQFHITTVFLLTSTAVTSSWYLAWQPDETVSHLLRSPGVIEHWQQRSETTTVPDQSNVTPALVVQAERFGLHLNPPPPPQPKARVIAKPVLTVPPKSTKPTPPRPTSANPKFLVLATSIYRDQPSQSMALISEPGDQQRWVKVGETVGHVSIEAIGQGQITWRENKRTGQMAVIQSSQQDPTTGSRLLTANQGSHSIPLVTKTKPPNRKPRPPNLRPITRGQGGRR